MLKQKVIKQCVNSFVAALDAKVDANHVEVIGHLSRNMAMLKKIHGALNLGENILDVDNLQTPATISVQLPATSMQQLIDLDKELEADKAKKKSLVRR